MKKLMRGLTLALLVQGAWADERGAKTGEGFDTSDRASACANAKRSAEGKVLVATVTGFSACDCSQSQSSKLWTCTVEAYWERKK